MPDLSLEPHARQHFDFLVSSKGYRCTASTPYGVRFESASAFVDLVFDGNRSFELDLYVGKKTRKNSQYFSYSLGEILKLRKAPEAKSMSLVSVTSERALASFVEIFARLLKNYGSDLIEGNQEGFLRLEEQRRNDSAAYAHECELRAARKRANEAWGKKDYSAVVRAFEPVRAALTPSEMKKLEIAEKRARLR
jgi:hypothetical protein